MIKLAPELERAVRALRGGPLPVGGEGQTYVVMAEKTYRELSGVADERDLQESVSALQNAMQDVQAGRTRLASEFLEELGRSDAVSR